MIVPPVKENCSTNISYPSPSAGSEHSSLNPDNIRQEETSTITQRRYSGEQSSSNQNGYSDGDDTSEVRFHSSPTLGASFSADPFNATRRVRRGAVSGEVYTEEDAASYVKKVVITSVISNFNSVELFQVLLFIIITVMSIISVSLVVLQKLSHNNGEAYKVSLSI